MSTDIRPIRTVADHEAALQRIESLWGSAVGTRDGDVLDVLTTLVEAYEDRQHPIGAPDPVDAITFRLSQMGLGRKDAQAIVGPRVPIGDILDRKRKLTIAMIRRLHEALGIPAQSLIGRTRRTELA